MFEETDGIRRRVSTVTCDRMPQRYRQMLQQEATGVNIRLSKAYTENGRSTRVFTTN